MLVPLGAAAVAILALLLLIRELKRIGRAEIEKELADETKDLALDQAQMWADRNKLSASRRLRIAAARKRKRDS